MHHSHEGHNHHHIHGREESTWRLIVALLLNVGITVAQVIGGILSGSLALLADAAHNGSDAASLGVSYAARRISRRRADRQRTFGYNRAEIIGAMINLTVLFVIALYLAYEAATRLFSPPEVHGSTMLIVGAIAFVEDAISVWLLYQGSKESLNIRSAFIHMIGDTLATLGVIVGGLLVMWYEIYWVDPVITAVIALYIFVHAYYEIRKAIRILMESAPVDFDLDGMVEAVQDIDGVEDVHHVHVWRLDEQRLALEAHVAITRRDLAAMEGIKRAVKDLLERDYGIGHSTLEIECEHCTGHEKAVIAHE